MSDKEKYTMTTNSETSNKSAADTALEAAAKSVTEAFGNVKSLKAYGQFDDLANIKKIDDIIDQPVLVKGYFLAKGQQGIYAMMDIDTLDHTEMHITCGGQWVLEALKNVKDQNAFPVIAIFYRRGKAILVK